VLNSKLILVLLLLFLSLPAAAQDTSSDGKSAAASLYKSGFATVHGIKLHYLDWGGTGETLLFITGTGDTAHVFDEMAPKFTDRFRVLALTRRGFGESDKPETGYDVKSLADDIRGFLDVMKIKRANLIGHSIAGNELTQFAAVYPKRTLTLVYLDAAYDRREVVELMKKDPLAQPEHLNKIDAAFRKGGRDFNPDYKKIKAPALSFYVIFETHFGLKPDADETTRKKAQEFIETVAQPYQWRNIERFRKEVAAGQAVVLRNTNHYFFKDPKIKDDIVNQIRVFLLSK